MAVVTSGGTITTVYDWVRDQVPDVSTLDPNDMVDDPNDNPPASVLAFEYCQASAETSDWSFDGVNYEGGFLALNGLGHPPIIITNYGLLVTGSWGWRVKKLAGTETITLVSTPSAMGFVDSSGGVMSADVTYSSQIISPTIKLDGITKRSDGYFIVTGQQIKSKIELKVSEPAFYSLNGIDQEITVSSNAWNTASEDAVTLFKSYIPTSSSAQLVSISSADKASEIFDLYTASEGNMRIKNSITVRFAHQVAYPDYFRFVDEFGTVGSNIIYKLQSPLIKSLKPVADGVFKGGAVIIHHNETLFGPAYADPSSESETETFTSEGEFWRAEISELETLPLAGDLCTVQIGTFNRKLVRSLIGAAPPGTPTTYKVVQNQQRLLDVGFPYTFPGVGAPQAYTDAEDELISWDSPSHCLVPGLLTPSSPYTNRWEQAIASDTFEDWIMFKPDPAFPGQNVAWVPLLKFSWSWAAVCNRDSSGNWEVTSQQAASSNNMSPTDEFPAWAGFKAYGSFNTFEPE